MRIRMKAWGIVMFGAVLAAMAMPMAPAHAVVPQVAVIDMMRVSDSYVRYVESRKVLEQRKLELQAIVDDEEKGVMALLEELEAVRATASQDDIMRRRQEIEARDRELRGFVQQTNMQFRDDLDTLQMRTKDEIETVVQMVSRQKGLTLVLERNMTLFADNSLDITDLIIAELNARFRPLPSAPARSARPAARPATPSPAASTPPASGAASDTPTRRLWAPRSNP